MVITIQQVKRGRIALDDIQYLFGVQAVRYALHHFDSLTKLSKPLSVDCIATKNILFQHRCRPTPELDTAQGMHTIADRNDHIKAINISMVQLVAIFAHMCKFCTHGLRIYFPLLNCITNMSANNRSVLAEQLCHLRLREPHTFRFKLNGQRDHAVR